jgi:hypothetical protein
LKHIVTEGFDCILVQMHLILCLFQYWSNDTSHLHLLLSYMLNSMCQKLEWFKQEPDDTLGYKFISFSLKASSLKNGLYLGIIWLGNYFWLLFQNNWANFSNLLVTLGPIEQCSLFVPKISMVECM